jgi:ribosomal protein S1
MTMGERYAVGQVRTGRVTRLGPFGAFVELEPGVEALAHASTFPPTGRADGWRNLVPPGTEASFEIVSIEPAKKRIGVSLVPAGSGDADAMRDYTDRAPDRLGSLADKLRGALSSRQKP